MGVRIITDSTCDIAREDQERMNIHVVPLTVNFPDASYEDGVDITNEEFFEKLDAYKTLPTTSSVSPQTFIDAFEEGLNAGDDIVGIFISGEVSGTLQSAFIAKDMIESDRIFLVDSRNTTLALALLVIEAVKNRDEGKSAEEIAEHISSLTPKVRLMAIMNTLKNLHKGGRLGFAPALIGDAIGLKPLASMVDGKVTAIGKAIGLPAAFKLTVQKVMDEIPDRQYGFTFGHACAPELFEKLVEYMKEHLQITEWFQCNIGCIVGTHVGKGAIGFAYVAE